MSTNILKRKLQQKSYRKEHPEKFLDDKEQHHQYDKSIVGKYSSAKSCAKYSNKEWNITKEEYTLIINKGCHYCNKEILNTNGSSLDRKDNTKGYTLDNVLPCCWYCNSLRGNKLTVTEMELVMKTLLEYRKVK